MKQGYLREGLWEKVYLLEFYKPGADTPSDSFGFGVPPESEEFTLTQRKSETKTFGGLVVDDYGADLLNIALTGTTVNNEKRRIYKTTGSSITYLTGEEEVYQLKSLIEKYKTDIELMGGKILLYDLSKHSNKKRKTSTVESFCWIVYPGEFKIKRSKDRPFVYTYSLNFTAERTDSLFVFNNTIFGVDFNKVFDKINKQIEQLENTMKFMPKALDAIAETRRFIAACKEVALYATSGTINAFKIVLDDTFTLGDSALELYRETIGSIIPFTMDNADFIAAMMVDLMLNVNKLTKKLISITQKDFYVPVGIFDDWELAMDETHSLAELTYYEIYRNITEMAVTYKMDRAREYQLQIGNNRSIITYGMNLVLVTDGDTFESIANKYYGDVSKTYIIASANACSSIEDLKARGITVVLVPILEKKEVNARNAILGLSTQRDNYGQDVALDDNGNILLNESGTDFLFVSGRKNISQAILMRLKENLNKRLRLQLYGIKTTIPDSESVGSAYIFSSIVQTLNQEPRIKNLISVNFRGDGDVLRIDVVYEDIGGRQSTLSSII